MANITILLREDIDTLGGRGEIVKVKAGYARNYLLPQGLATLATKGNVKQIDGERSALLRKAAVEKSTADAQKSQMSSIVLTFERKAGEGGTLFGSVTSMDVAEAIQAKGYEIDRRKIIMKDAIKETGEYTVKVKLHRDVVLEIPVTVAAEGGEVESKDEKKGRKAKPEAKIEAVKAKEAVEETVAETEEADDPEAEG